MEPLISVIVPVYNVEKYLDRCITSIVEQTYKNLEIILVDDGSPDNSGAICDEWAKKDSRIKVYYNKNFGQGYARNYGVNRSEGQYISFIDSDDYVLSNYIEYLYTNLQKYDADISCCEYEVVYKEYKPHKLIESDDFAPIKILNGRESCFDSLVSCIYVSPCCKLYNRDIITRFPFPVGRLHEDAAVSCKFFYNSDRIVIGYKKLYYYYQNEKSTMHTMNTKRLIDEPWAISQRAEFYKQKKERALEIYEWGQVIKIYITHAQILNSRFSKDAFIFAQKHWFNGDLSFKVKFKFILFATSPKLYDIIIKLITR